MEGGITVQLPYIHVNHVQLMYTVINVQDGGGDIYMWELLTCGSSIHV